MICEKSYECRLREYCGRRDGLTVLQSYLNGRECRRESILRVTKRKNMAQRPVVLSTESKKHTQHALLEYAAENNQHVVLYWVLESSPGIICHSDCNVTREQ